MAAKPKPSAQTKVQSKQDHDQFIVVRPLTPKGKWLVCTRRVGSKDGFTVYAEAKCEGNAETIVAAMRTHQGELDKLDTPAQKEIANLRSAVDMHRTACDNARRKAADKDGELRTAKYKMEGMQMQIDTLNRQLQKLQGNVPPPSPSPTAV